MLRILALLTLTLAPLPALAHKVILDVFPSGNVIEGELGFSNGDMAADALIEVFDDAGNKLGETATDADGLFTYAPTAPVAHVFRSDLSAGHVGIAEMSADDVADILKVAAEMAAAAEATAPAPATGSVTVASLTMEEKLAIAEVVRREVRPLRQEITAYKEHNNFQTILGGIGYIIGLFGVGFYIAARRKLAGK